MPTYSPDELNAQADDVASRVQFVSIHTATPGATGASEAAGDDYVRAAATFTGAGVEGVLGAVLQPATAGVSWSDLLTFALPIGTFTHVGYFDEVTVGTFRGGGALPASLTLAGPDQLKIGVGVGPGVIS